jgi:hypothetical protein
LLEAFYKPRGSLQVSMLLVLLLLLLLYIYILG